MRRVETTRTLEEHHGGICVSFRDAVNAPNWQFLYPKAEEITVSFDTNDGLGDGTKQKGCAHDLV